MYNKKHHLSSIPENEESEEVLQEKQYVSKNKHDVLKAKYKCLKKLFQIYDASIIGLLPTDISEEDGYEIRDETRKHSRRRKRSYRTKSDACAGTNEPSCGDVSLSTKDSIESSVMRDLNVKRSCSTQVMTDLDDKKTDNLDTKTSKTSTNEDQYVSMNQCLPEIPMHYLMMNEFDRPRKLTRFQSFLQRLFGIRREKVVMPNGHVYAYSDNNLMQQYGEKRRRRGLRFRRLRKAKKVHSEIQLRDLSSPTIMSYVQSIQKNFLMDNTPRQCPITGCKNIFYGIINYNDHLTLCHFSEKKYICHYCHEGFEDNNEKLIHENEHLGITKIKSTLFNVSCNSKQSKSNDTQTEPQTRLPREVPEEKLKKIVSFFDKMVNSEQMSSEYKKSWFSMSNLQCGTESETVTETDTASSDKRTLSCQDQLGKKSKNRTLSDRTSKCPIEIKCHCCGEEFDNRHLLNMHMNLEHGTHIKFSKFHSCAGLSVNKRLECGTVKSETGKINITSSNNLNADESTVSVFSSSEVSRQKSSNLNCGKSADIIYCDSMSLSSIKQQPSGFKSRKLEGGTTPYQWEPGTKIIRV